ncbi:MAG: hypothetical protein IT180_06650 [Acidobacteria bacterium]|nr:hypothetical protein [Acidobacteriota bacterium]
MMQLRRSPGSGNYDPGYLLVKQAEEQAPALAEVSGSLATEDAQELREIIDREFERVDPREW